jgi:hypothetical protein
MSYITDKVWSFYFSHPRYFLVGRDVGRSWRVLDAPATQLNHP